MIFYFKNLNSSIIFLVLATKSLKYFLPSQNEGEMIVKRKSKMFVFILFFHSITNVFSKICKLEMFLLRILQTNDVRVDNLSLKEE